MLFLRTFNAEYDPHWLVAVLVPFGTVVVVFGSYLFMVIRPMFKTMWQDRRQTREVLRSFDVSKVVDSITTYGLYSIQIVCDY